MYAAMGDLIVFYDHQTSDQGENASDVQNCMNIRASYLLRGCVRWLENQDGLGSQEYSGGIEELFGRSSVKGTNRR